MKLRWIAVPFVFAAVLAAGHVYQVINGVHFKVRGEEVDFGLPPSRFSDKTVNPISYAEWRPGTAYTDPDYDEWLKIEAWEGRRRVNQNALYRKAREAEQRDDRAAALAIYRQMDKRGLGASGFVRGRIDLFTAVGSRPVDGLSAFLDATARGPKPPQSWSATNDPAFAPFVAYERALATPSDGAKLTPDLIAVAERYPESPRAPAALIMASRALTQERRDWYPPADLRAASGAVHLLLHRYPKSRFAWAARGELGRIAFVQKRYAEALRHYDIQVAGAKDRTEKRKALTSILLTEDAWGRRDRVAATCLRLMPFAKQRGYVVLRLAESLGFFDAKDALRFGKALRADPALLAEYLEYRTDFTTPTKDLFRFSTTPRITSLSLARLASVALKLKDAPRAKRYASRALQRLDERDAHALATFTLATLDRRANRKVAARDKYESILYRWPKSYLAGGARENLALLNEQLGDLGNALDQYTELGYHEDFAYLIDARMSSAELAHYIATRPRHAKRSTLIYTLGMRYLREGKWARAERAFGTLSTYQRRYLTSGNQYIDEGGLQDPKASLKALRGLDRKVDQARGREAKAAALYAMGDYYYRHRQLLLYSAPAWEGVRSVAFSHSWNAAVAQPEDDRALARHHDEHEAVAQALKIFRRVVRDYPGTEAAPKAAYWGACAASRLSDYAEYWRWRDRDGHLRAEAVRLMRFAKRAKDPKLAKKAEKYYGVFRADYANARMTFAKEKSLERRFRAYRW